MDGGYYEEAADGSNSRIQKLWHGWQSFSTRTQSFTQSFGGEQLDASLLLLPQVGFLAISDARISSTIAAIERELLVDGFVLRYRSESVADGLPPGEGVFIPCSFWLVDVYQRQGRDAEASRLLDRLIALRNGRSRALRPKWASEATLLFGRMRLVCDHHA